MGVTEVRLSHGTQDMGTKFLQEGSSAPSVLLPEVTPRPFMSSSTCPLSPSPHSPLGHMAFLKPSHAAHKSQEGGPQSPPFSFYHLGPFWRRHWAAGSFKPPPALPLLCLASQLFHHLYHQFPAFSTLC